MLSLRTLHLLFILVAIIAADMFGAWAVWDHSRSNDVLTLIVGVLSFVFGFALIGYGIWVVRKFDRAKIG